MKRGSLLVLSMLAMTGAAMAQEQPAPFPPVLSNRLQLNGTLELYLKQVMDPFRAAAGRSGVLQRKDVVSRAQKQDAATRQKIVAQLIELDIDRDGVVTAAEIEAVRNLPRGRAMTFLADALLAERGGTSLSIIDVYKDQPPVDSGRLDTTLEGYLALGDGEQVTAAQVIEQALATFRAVDTDGNTVIAAEEMAFAEPRIAKLRVNRTLERALEIAGLSEDRCAFPPPSATAETVLLGAYEGEALASVYIGQPDAETSASNVVVQPGDTPLYIVAVSHEAQIWSVSGAVERVEKFIVAAPAAGERSGVAGLPRDRVAFGAAYGPPCIDHFYRSGTGETARARRAFQRAVGEEADHVGGAYGLVSITVPDMAVAEVPRGSGPPAPEGFDARTWREALRFSPGGLARFDPASVVSMQPAQSYEVLPQQIGLAQLVYSGHLERSGGTFRIARPIPYFPAGLNGAHSVTFVLGKGVPMPGGSPGHSCVIVEETGEPASPRPACRVKRDSGGAFK